MAIMSYMAQLLQAQTSILNTQTSANATLANAELMSSASRYGSELAQYASMYGADLGYQGTVYHSDKSYEATINSNPVAKAFDIVGNPNNNTVDDALSTFRTFVNKANDLTDKGKAEAEAWLKRWDSAKLKILVHIRVEKYLIGRNSIPENKNVESQPRTLLMYRG